MSQINTYVKLILLTTILVACSKTKINHNQIQGDWTCEIVKIEDGSGFIYYDTLTTENTIRMSHDSIFSSIYFHFKPLGETFSISDSLFMNCDYDIERDEITVQSKQIDFRLKHISKSNLVMAYYDIENFRLKTFYLSKQ